MSANLEDIKRRVLAALEADRTLLIVPLPELSAVLAEDERLLAEVERLQFERTELIAILRERHTCPECGGKGVTWVAIGEEGDFEVCACWGAADELLVRLTKPELPLFDAEQPDGRR